MEENRILLIAGNESGFIEKSVFDGLSNAEMNVEITIFGDAALNDRIKEATIVVIVAGTAVDIHSPVIASVKQKCQELKKYVALYGTADEVEQLQRVFPENMVVSAFKRPVTNEELVDELKKALVKVEVQNRRKNILVVDDSGQMLRTIMRWLQDYYQVNVANSAANAFASIQRVMPDLILLDYEMPICSGAQFFEMLRAEEKTKNIPVVFLTSKNDAETVKSVLALKPEGYILKTSPEEKVLKTIAELFEI